MLLATSKFIVIFHKICKNSEYHVKYLYLYLQRVFSKTIPVKDLYKSKTIWRF